MGNFIKKVKNYIQKKMSNKKLNQQKLTFEEKIELGLNPNFHGNNRAHNINIGKNSYVSFNSIIYYAEIGDFCSIGPNVVIGYGDHPTNMISTSPYIYLNNLLFDISEKEEFLIPHFKKVKIENDVWIGANVYIKNGVTIGNGAIIGAGSVVLKDVGEYEIVGGVPANLIRKRFDDEVIKLLLETKWWLLDIEILKKYKKVLRSPNESSLKEMIKNIGNDK